MAALGVTRPAQASPLEESRARARALAADIAALDARIDEAVLRYARATEALNDVEQAIRRTRRRQAIARYELGVARGILTERAVSLYKSRAVTSLDVLTGADDFAELVDQLVMFEAVQRGDRETVHAIAAASGELADRAARLADHLRTAERLADQRAAECAAIREQLRERRAMLVGVRAEIRRLVEARRPTVVEGQSAVKPPENPGAGGSGRWWPLIQRAAAANGVSARGMYRLMMIESGGSATLVAAGRYYGLFQYCVSTWNGSWNPYRTCSIVDGAAQIRATALALRMGKGPFWWRNTYPWAFG